MKGWGSTVTFRPLSSEEPGFFKPQSLQRGRQGACRHLVAVFLNCRSFGWTERESRICKQNT